MEDGLYGHPACMYVCTYVYIYVHIFVCAVVYGVTTGFGKFARVVIAENQLE